MNESLPAVDQLIRENISCLLSQSEEALTPSHLSRLIGRDDSYIRGVLSGRFVPSTRALADISRELGVPVCYFFMEHPANPSSNEEVLPS